MSRIYEKLCPNGVKVGLYKKDCCVGNDLPYVLNVHKGDKTDHYGIETLAVANREYHKCVAENTPCPF